MLLLNNQQACWTHEKQKIHYNKKIRKKQTEKTSDITRVVLTIDKPMIKL